MLDLKGSNLRPSMLLRNKLLAGPPDFETPRDISWLTMPGRTTSFYTRTHRLASKGCVVQVALQVDLGALQHELTAKSHT